MLRDVHDLLRGGRGAVVTALADVHRMVGVWLINIARRVTQRTLNPRLLNGTLVNGTL